MNASEIAELVRSEEKRQALARAWWNHPLARHAMEVAGPEDRWGPAGPVEAIGYQFMVAGLVLVGDVDPALGAAPFDGDFRGLVLLALTLHDSPTYFITRRILEIALAAPLPDYTLNVDLPHPSMSILWQGELVLRDQDHAKELDWGWTVVVDNPERGNLLLYMGGRIAKDRLGVVGRTGHYGQRLGGNDASNQEVEASEWAILTKLIAFINSPYVSSSLLHLSRPIRKSLRDAHMSTETLLHVVTLRREASNAQRDFDAADREYRHQWWVSGHYRSQWYPSLDRHRTIWIAPYLKGPSGAPMIQHVFEVKR